jgi:hypothetical protein
MKFAATSVITGQRDIGGTQAEWVPEAARRYLEQQARRERDHPICGRAPPSPAGRGGKPPVPLHSQLPRATN